MASRWRVRTAVTSSSCSIALVHHSRGTNYSSERMTRNEHSGTTSRYRSLARATLLVNAVDFGSGPFLVRLAILSRLSFLTRDSCLPLAVVVFAVGQSVSDENHLVPEIHRDDESILISANIDDNLVLDGILGSNWAKPFCSRTRPVGSDCASSPRPASRRPHIATRRARVCSASSTGVTPKSSLNSRLNCDGLS